MVSWLEVHFRSMIGIKFLGLMALAALLTVEWISELRSNESQRVIELTGLGKEPRNRLATAKTWPEIASKRLKRSEIASKTS